MIRLYKKIFAYNRMILGKLKKHLDQIKKGGLIVIIKKFRTCIYFIFQVPVYLSSIILIIIIRSIKPWLLIRWFGLKAGRIGHLVVNTELYSCRQEAKINQPSQKCFDIFFLNSKNICNKQLIKMLERSLIIFPAFLMIPLFYVNRFFNLFIDAGNQHEIDINVDVERDVHGVMDKMNPHISFNDEEKIKGEKILREFGIPEHSKFVCLTVRDSAYLDRYKNLTLRDFSYHNYRDCDVDNFLLAAEELANRGYYVFRMGVKVLKPLKSSNPKVIDYANSKMRSDFMDMYLSANCTFGISTATGLDMVLYVFRKPIAYTSVVPISHMQVQAKNDLHIPKHHFNKKNKKRLTVSEIFSSNVAFSLASDEYQNNNIELLGNTPEEIKELVIEMDERISGNWKETQEDLRLQKQVWNVYENNMQKMYLQNPKDPYFEWRDIKNGLKIKSKFSASFLRNNQDWIK